jgi:hypothetical protein
MNAKECAKNLIEDPSIYEYDEFVDHNKKERE